jgi:hypothetical protein
MCFILVLGKRNKLYDYYVGVFATILRIIYAQIKFVRNIYLSSLRPSITRHSVSMKSLKVDTSSPYNISLASFVSEQLLKTRIVL